MISKILILPVGLACTLRCKYCINNSQRNFAKIKVDVMEEKILRRIFLEVKPKLEKNKRLTIIWNGGEATLAGINFYEMAVELEKEIFEDIEIENGIQTSGIFINDNWCKFFKKSGFAPSISLDGPQWLHDKLRLDNNGKGTYSRVYDRYQLMKSYNLQVGALGVISPNNADYPEEIIDWLEKDMINSWDFLLSYEPPESNNNLSIDNGSAICFMTKLFDEWFKRDNPKIRIRTFRDIIRSQLGNKPTLCSWQRGCIKFASFDNLGNVFLCTKFHVYPETSYGNITEKNLSGILDSKKVQDINNNIYQSQTECRDCKWVNSCGGGCSFTRYSTFKSFNAPFVHCEARKALFEYINYRIKDFI